MFHFVIFRSAGAKTGRPEVCVYLKPCRESGELLFPGFILSKQTVFYQPWKWASPQLKRKKEIKANKQIQEKKRISINPKGSVRLNSTNKTCSFWTVGAALLGCFSRPHKRFCLDKSCNSPHFSQSTRAINESVDEWIISWSPTDRRHHLSKGRPLFPHSCGKNLYHWSLAKKVQTAEEDSIVISNW